MDQILAPVMVALLAALALMAAIPGPLGESVRGTLLRTRRGADPVDAGDATGADDAADVGPAPRPSARYREVGRASDLRPAALDRIIRVATWVFLLTVTTIVAVTDLWGDRQGAILVLVGLAALYTFVLHELVPPSVPDAFLLIVEGAMAVVFAAVLVALTGGVASPFFFALPLIVVGAAIVVTPGMALGLTAGAALAYVVAVLASSPALDAASLATVAVNLTALGLIGYIGMAIGREQRRARMETSRLASVDPLTGLRTRPYLFSALDRELARSQRTGRAFCLLMIDMDDLKGINDRAGHLAGDRALRLVGDTVLAGIRRIDTGARFGGDEFVVLLPETDATGGWILAEKIRQGVAAAGIEVDGRRLPTSVSVGLVTYPQDGERVGELLERADEAMYRSKRGGRDRTTGVPVMEADVTAAGGPVRTRPTGGRGDPV
ncbi:MAG TPA: GGDEF domain-containing protein [Candidatus Limnocylindrales bacterium]|nr:GGDEF domain-containing protein [Candidatus Limnocylindrales bacterium]